MATSLHPIHDHATIEFHSFIRGYHVNQTTWPSIMGDVLCLKHEPSNCSDRFAAVVMDRSTNVGHLSYNVAPMISHFLMRSVNSGEAVVTGQRINRGAGYGLEILSKYKLYGPRSFIDKLKERITVHMDKVTVLPEIGYVV